ncbi:hypothetical protein LTR37_002115 [Vermiconidia calcicola]|uniref:Uncharacterized protein n=1 Tax=Vermiconidia calcicola TaxID=1690605 RepID=A0ACC3NVI3_9PEZI|nr:hypothetical protein LTR37_002115 [Vermiconidia calcicola]
MADQAAMAAAEFPDPRSMSNTVRVFKALDADMIKRHREGTDESRAEAEHIAKTLVSHADLPLVFRARACMVLGCAKEPGYVGWAKEAVRIVKLGIEAMGGTPGAAEARLLRQCQQTLDNAEQDYEELANDAEGMEGEEDTEIEGSEEEEVVYRDGEGEVSERAYSGAGGGQGATVHSTRGSAGGPMEVNQRDSEKKKRLRRVHSGDQDTDPIWEEFDKAKGNYVPLGTATEPEYLDIDEEGIIMGDSK